MNSLDSKFAKNILERKKYRELNLHIELNFITTSEKFFKQFLNNYKHNERIFGFIDRSIYGPFDDEYGEAKNSFYFLYGNKEISFTFDYQALNLDIDFITNDRLGWGYQYWILLYDIHCLKKLDSIQKLIENILYYNETKASYDIYPHKELLVFFIENVKKICKKLSKPSKLDYEIINMMKQLQEKSILQKLFKGNIKKKDFTNLVLENIIYLEKEKMKVENES